MCGTPRRSLSADANVVLPTPVTPTTATRFMHKLTHGWDVSAGTVEDVEGRKGRLITHEVFTVAQRADTKWPAFVGDGRAAEGGPAGGRCGTRPLSLLRIPFAPQLDGTDGLVVAVLGLGRLGETHLAALARLAERAGLLRDPEQAVARLKLVLALPGL